MIIPTPTIEFQQTYKLDTIYSLFTFVFVTLFQSSISRILRLTSTLCRSRLCYNGSYFNRADLLTQLKRT